MSSKFRNKTAGLTGKYLFPQNKHWSWSTYENRRIQGMYQIFVHSLPQHTRADYVSYISSINAIFKSRKYLLGFGNGDSNTLQSGIEAIVKLTALTDSKNNKSHLGQVSLFLVNIK